MSITDVLAEYSHIQQENEKETARRRDEVYMRLPELKAMHERLEALLIARPKLKLTGEPDNSDQIKALREQCEALLAGAGFDAHYLDPIYTCALCRDTGLLENTTRCECFKKHDLEDKLDAARLTDDAASFEKFDLNRFGTDPIENGKSQRDMMARIRDISVAYADSFPSCLSILLLSGGVGLGKTYVSKCIMRRVIERGFTAANFTAYRLFSLFHQHRLGEDVDLDPILEVPLLIIDDIGTEPMTKNVTKEYFFDLLNERSAAGRKTVIATNLPFHELDERYGERIFSRLMDTRFSQKILFKGRDIRY
jgi:DNA replication protein DnaC